MDPSATLDLMANAYDVGDYPLAWECLANYREWRKKGGFEPQMGDKYANMYGKMLLVQIVVSAPTIAPETSASMSFVPIQATRQFLL